MSPVDYFLITLAIVGGVISPFFVWYLLMLIIGLNLSLMGVISGWRERIAEHREKRVWEVTSNSSDKTYTIRLYQSNRLVHKFSLTEEQLPPLGAPNE